MKKKKPIRYQLSAIQERRFCQKCGKQVAWGELSDKQLEEKNKNRKKKVKKKYRAKQKYLTVNLNGYPHSCKAQIIKHSNEKSEIKITQKDLMMHPGLTLDEIKAKKSNDEREAGPTKGP